MCKTLQAKGKKVFCPAEQRVKSSYFLPRDIKIIFTTKNAFLVFLVTSVFISKHSSGPTEYLSE